VKVFFEESGEEREVKGFCSVCFAGGEGADPPVDLVSPSGLVHAGLDGGKTFCGYDATGDDWWWRV